MHLPIYVQQRFADASRNGAYGAAVASIDWTTDVILTELRRLGLDDDTIVIFTSDNGSRARDEGGSNEPLLGTKGQTWDGGLRVPFVVRWPGQVPAGAVCSEVVSSIDLLPTFATIAGGELPAQAIDGCDVSALLRGESGDPHRVFAYFRGTTWPRSDVAGGSCTCARRRTGRGAVRPRRRRRGDDRRGGRPRRRRRRAPGGRVGGARRPRRRPTGDGRTGPATGRRRHRPHPLTTYDPDHPYYANEYDLTDRG
ncbi:MAG: sulfatase-like hydrolase/transferase [Ilumatobacteraceae bacterium]